MRVSHLFFVPVLLVTSLSCDPREESFSYAPGEPVTKQVLVELTEKYGGIRDIRQGRGGDKFSLHDYGAVYAEYFDAVKDKPVTLVEVGVLEGTSLAVWSDVFPKGRIIGIDIALEPYHERLPKLKRLGAFSNNNVEVYELDSTKPETGARLKSILGEDTVDIFIDDGCHLTECILSTLANLLPVMGSGGVCLLEDNREVHNQIREEHPFLEVIGPINNELTVVEVSEDSPKS